MFKKSNFKGQIHLINRYNELIKKMPINHIPYNNELILKLSVEKFNDEDPCIIHQTYCQNMLAEILREKINKEHPDLTGKQITLENIPLDILEMIDTTKLTGIGYVKFI